MIKVGVFALQVRSIPPLFPDTHRERLLNMKQPFENAATQLETVSLSKFELLRTWTGLTVSSSPVVNRQR